MGVGGIPDPLADLGEVFLPVEPMEKGPRLPRTPEHLMGPDDEILQAYLEAGHSYAIACRGDLVVIDADAPDVLADALNELPATAWQVSGSRVSEHHFFEVPGLDRDIPLKNPETGENVGHVKAAEQSVVIGPGSPHESGHRYGPLHGDDFATVDKDDFLATLESFIEESHHSATESTGADRAEGSVGSWRELSVYDLLSRSKYPDGQRVAHPSFMHASASETGRNFMVDDAGETFRCWRHGITGNVLHLVGIKAGIIKCPDWRNGLDTTTWHAILEAAQHAGLDVGDGDQRPEPIAVLPGVRDLTPMSKEWDWRHTGVDAPLSVDEVRARTQDAIATAYEHGDRVLIEAIMTAGKSHGAIAAAADTGEPVTILTGRGPTEQYDQFKAWCDEYDLSYYELPSFTRHCETANGEHGDEWEDRVRDWYARGATPKAIHKFAELAYGEPLPCQCHDGQQCPYASRWTFEPDNYDVLIGHYTHAYKVKVTSGRTVVLDEFPGAYESTLFGDGNLEAAVSCWLDRTEGVPFADYTDLLEHRGDAERRADALLWFTEEEHLYPDETHVFEHPRAHAHAPLAVFAILAAEDLGNGFERADLPELGTGVRNRQTGNVTTLVPPDLTYASGVVALDGTPTREMWELVLDEHLNHREVLTSPERVEYVRDGLNLTLVRTTEAVKPYNSGEHVAVEQDAALLERIVDEHGERPSVITTRTARDAYQDAAVAGTEFIDGLKWYGDIRGSNEFDDVRLGAVIGSNHYGDHYIKKWGAYAGEAVDRSEAKGAALSYGSFGDKILTHMREHDTLQAVMRFGRDGGGAVVYVHTDTLPEWVPVVAEGRVVNTWSDGMRQVLDVIEDLDLWTTAEVADHSGVEVGRRQVFNILSDLADRGVIAGEIDGNGYVWWEDGLHRLSAYGDVELDPVSIGAVSDGESEEISRMSIFKWEISPAQSEGTPDPVQSASTGDTPAQPSVERDNRGGSPTHGPR